MQIFGEMPKHGNSCCAEEPEVKKEEPREMKLFSLPVISGPAPPWSGIAVHDLKICDLSLDHYKGKYLLLFFYPLDFTFVCPTELIQFNDRADEFRNIGCEVVAVSTDSEYCHLAWIMTPRKQGGLGNVKIPILSDKNHEVSRKYGVLDESLGIPLKALFIIDHEQLIRHITINEIALPRSVDEALRVVEACKFVDKYGHTCPIGPKRSKPSVEEKQNFFSFN